MTDLPITLSPMTVEDVPAVHAMEVACFSAPRDIDAYYGEAANPASYYVVARRGEEIVGFAGMWAVAPDAHIVTIATAAAHRRTGVAHRIMEDLLAECPRRGVTHITLEVRAGNTPAQQLYLAFGFHVLGRRRRYYPDNNEDALVMGREV